MKNDRTFCSTPIEDDFKLLDLMVSDANKVDEIYQPGPYWMNKTKSAVRELKKFGLSEFRGSVNSAGTSFTDNSIVDRRGSYNFGRASGLSYITRSILAKIYRDVYPFNQLFDTQVSLTIDYYNSMIKYQSDFLKKNDRVKSLLKKYIMPEDTSKGGCLSSGDFDGKQISHHYLELLNSLDHVLQNINVESKRSFFEIGGGFGTNTHLLIENAPSIKKVIYLDIAPNLYIGTQYLKSFFGRSVIDYRQSKNMDTITFSNNDELEIFCIMPSQIELIDADIDLFHNAHSFVEMPKTVVQNYAKNIERILSKTNGSISLISYDNFDLNTTFPPDELISFFSCSFEKTVLQTSPIQNSNCYYYLSS